MIETHNYVPTFRFKSIKSLLSEFSQSPQDILYSIDGGKIKNIFSTPTSTVKGGKKEKYYMM